MTIFGAMSDIAVAFATCWDHLLSTFVIIRGGDQESNSSFWIWFRIKARGVLRVCIFGDLGVRLARIIVVLWRTPLYSLDFLSNSSLALWETWFLKARSNYSSLRYLSNHLRSLGSNMSFYFQMEFLALICLTLMKVWGQLLILVVLRWLGYLGTWLGLFRWRQATLFVLGPEGFVWCLHTWRGWCSFYLGLCHWGNRHDIGESIDSLGEFVELATNYRGIEVLSFLECACSRLPLGRDMLGWLSFELCIWHGAYLNTTQYQCKEKGSRQR